MPGRHPSQSHPPIQAKPQTGAAPAPQDSPLAKEVRDAWAKEKKIEDVLEILAREDVRKTKDTILDAELVSLLAGRPDDLWVARRIREGKLGETTGLVGPYEKVMDPNTKVEKLQPKPRPIEALFFPGSSDRRALVIAGVHGSERQGMEAANMLIEELQKPGQAPYFTTIVIPSMFPDSKARGDEIAAMKDAKARQKKIKDDEAREYGRDKDKDTPTNRNFPKDFDFAAWVAGGRKPLKDATGKKDILQENLLLMELIERFRPERIISIHGTKRPGEAGVFYDARELREEEKQAAKFWAAWTAAMLVTLSGDLILTHFGSLQALESKLLRDLLADMSAQAVSTDEALSLKAAEKIHDVTESMKGREGLSFDRKEDDDKLKALDDKRKAAEEDENKAMQAANKVGDVAKEQALRETQKKNQQIHQNKRDSLTKDFATQVKLRQKHPSIGGNIDSAGEIRKATWSGGVPGGVSLGGYAPKRGISVFTVEPPLNYASGDKDKFGDSVTAKARQTELKAYADVVRTVLLGKP